MVEWREQVNGILSECSWLQTQKHSVFRNSDVKPCLREQSMCTLRRETVTLNHKNRDGQWPQGRRRMRWWAPCRADGNPPELPPARPRSRCDLCRVLSPGHPGDCKNLWNTQTALCATVPPKTCLVILLRKGRNTEPTTNSEHTNKGFYPTVHLEMSESSLDVSVENTL